VKHSNEHFHSNVCELSNWTCVGIISTSEDSNRPHMQGKNVDLNI